MITTIFLYVIGVFVSGIGAIFLLISYTIPSSIITAFENFFSYFAYAQGILPIVPNPGAGGLWGSVGLLTILGYGLQFLVLWYTVKLILFVFGLLPFVGKHSPLPGHSQIHHKK